MAARDQYTPQAFRQGSISTKTKHKRQTKTFLHEEHIKDY